MLFSKCPSQMSYPHCRCRAAHTFVLAWLSIVLQWLGSWLWGFLHKSIRKFAIYSSQFAMRLLGRKGKLKICFHVTANEMWCLARFLPLLIGEFIPEDDDHWEAYCILLEIVRIAFSPLISKQQMPYLQILIQNHHERFKTLYPLASIIPKMHYMIHMPRTILR